MSPISPWSGDADCTSPDGRFRATIFDAIPIAMGGPTRGLLIVTDIQTGREVTRLDSCNPCVAWSNDSAALAVPQWTNDLKQHLCVLFVANGSIRRIAEDFSVLEIQSFENGRIRVIDSPIYMPRTLEISFESPP